MKMLNSDPIFHESHNGASIFVIKRKRKNYSYVKRVQNSPTYHASLFSYQIFDQNHNRIENFLLSQTILSQIIPILLICPITRKPLGYGQSLDQNSLK